jgi:HPt (histidine-containing phosphotransfer) domain-containing protein
MRRLRMLLGMVDTSPSVNRRLQQLGDVLQRWLDDLDSLVAELESLWCCRVKDSRLATHEKFVTLCLTAAAPWRAVFG